MNIVAFGLFLLAAEQPSLSDLSGGFPELKKAFNETEGYMRLIVLVSPT